MPGGSIHDLCGLYALDLLDPADRGRFERHLAGCGRCAAELRDHREGLGLLGATEGRRPPARLRDRIMARVRADRPLDVWVTDAATGIGRRRLGRSETVRIAAGSEYRLDAEEWLVLDGAPTVDGAPAKPGAFGAARAEPVTVHARSSPVTLFVVGHNPAHLPLPGPGAAERWSAVAPGVELRFLRRASGASFLTMVRMAPGGILPEHEHEGDEESLVTAGECRSGGNLYAAGDVLRMPAGTRHDPVITEHGCEMVVLVEPAEDPPTASPT